MRSCHGSKLLLQVWSTMWARKKFVACSPFSSLLTRNVAQSLLLHTTSFSSEQERSMLRSQGACFHLKQHGGATSYTAHSVDYLFLCTCIGTVMLAAQWICYLPSAVSRSSKLYFSLTPLKVDDWGICIIGPSTHLDKGQHIWICQWSLGLWFIRKK